VDGLFSPLESGGIEAVDWSADSRESENHIGYSGRFSVGMFDVNADISQDSLKVVFYGRSHLVIDGA